MITSKNELWKLGQIKFSFPVEKNSSKKGVYFIGDHTIAEQQFEPSYLIRNTFLYAFGIYWKRISPYFETDVDLEEKLALLNSPSPVIKKIDSTTIVFRIPSFENNFITIIDSLVNSNRQLFLSTKNLVIDIRGNGGGADRCYTSITPLLYTNPIRSMWITYLSTPLNNARYNWIINLPGFSEKEKQGFRDMQNKLNANLGHFVNLNEAKQMVVIDSLTEVLPNPQQVAILIDGRNASTAEQFTLMAKQSKKVKLFGQKTTGALDFSNLNNVTSPSNHFTLFYATSKSFRIPKLAIDDYGLQPDFFIDESVPSYKWLEFALEVINTK